jgi:hypothetical protein
MTATKRPAQQLANQRAAAERLAASAQREATHERLRDAAADALVWLQWLQQVHAIGRLALAGTAPAVVAENKVILQSAIEALATALEEK